MQIFKVSDEQSILGTCQLSNSVDYILLFILSAQLQVQHQPQDILTTGEQLCFFFLHLFGVSLAVLPSDVHTENFKAVVVTNSVTIRLSMSVGKLIKGYI